MNAFGKFLGQAGMALARTPSPHPPPSTNSSSTRPSADEDEQPVASTSSSSPPEHSQTLPANPVKSSSTTTPPSSSSSSEYRRHRSRGSQSSPTSPISPKTIPQGSYFNSNSRDRRGQPFASGSGSGSGSRMTRLSSSMKSDDHSSIEPRSRSPSLPRSRNGSATSPQLGPPRPGSSRLAQKKPPLPSLAKAIYASDHLRPSPMTSQSMSGASTTWRNVSSKLNTKDELLMSLLASQAIVDSRDSEILTAEDVEELKREYALCNSRVTAAARKVTVETKIRDASLTMYNLDPSSSDAMAELNAANSKLEIAQQDLYRHSERANALGQRLLEHRAGVLSFSMRSLEKKAATLAAGHANSTDTDSESSTELAGEMSPASTAATSLSMAPPRKFDGAHLYAGHEGSVMPTSPQVVATAREANSRLKQANEAIEIGKKRIAELERELEMLGLDKTQLEMASGLELQTAMDKIARLQSEVERLSGISTQLEQERRAWERDKRELEDLVKAADRGPYLDREREETVFQLRAEVLIRDSENKRLLDEKRALEAEKESLRQSLTDYQAGTTEEVIVAREALRAMCRHHKVVVPPGDSKLITFIQALEGQKDQMIEGKESLLNQLEDARREREEARKEVRAMEIKIKESEFDRIANPALSRRPSANSIDTDQVLSVLKPIWSILPSVEVRASRLGISRTTSISTPRSPKLKIVSLDSTHQPMSLSELDVKSLKALYDPKGPYLSPNVTGEFTIEEFAGRVQALIADDKALVERLLRFAQAHDLLKTNAERAQKLAQESSQGLETYSKQVKTLEERCSSLTAKQTSLMDEIDDLQHNLERVEEEKRILESQSIEQGRIVETLENSSPSASGDATRIEELEKELLDAKKELVEVSDVLERTMVAESTQRVALLDELNSLQQENGNLRNQLRRQGSSK